MKKANSFAVCGHVYLYACGFITTYLARLSHSLNHEAQYVEQEIKSAALIFGPFICLFSSFRRLFFYF